MLFHLVRTPWSCGLTCHVFDWKDMGSKTAVASSHRFLPVPINLLFNIDLPVPINFFTRRWKARRMEGEEMESKRRRKVETQFEYLTSSGAIYIQTIDFF